MKIEEMTNKERIAAEKEWYSSGEAYKDLLGFGIKQSDPFPGNPLDLGIDISNPIKINEEADLNFNLLNELRPILEDVMAGDPEALNRPEYTCLNLANIRLAIDYLLQHNGFSDFTLNALTKDPWRLVYRSRPPTPTEFLGFKYIGPQADALFEHIPSIFEEGLDPTKPHRTIVLYPSIGAGKSTLAILYSLYISTCVSLMWAPYKFFGLAPSTIFTQVYCAASQKKSSELLFEPMLQLLESAPFFIKARTKYDMQKGMKEFENELEPQHIFWTTATPSSSIQFSGGMNYKLISSPNGLLGQSIITGTLTEINFLIESGKSPSWIYKLFTKLRQRIVSRLGSNYYARFIIDSSPNTLEDNPVEQWINEDAPKSKSNYIVKGARWDFFKKDFPDFKDKNGEINLEKAFYLYKGGDGNLPHVVEQGTLAHYVADDLVLCPKNSVDTSYEDMARENPIEFMRDYCGLPSDSADRIFYNKEIVNNIFCERLRNMYAYIEAPSQEQPEHLIWDQVRDMFFYKIINSYYFWYAPEIPRVITVDQSITGDVTCIAVSHTERDPTLIDKETKDFQIVYITDFVINIIPNGNRINLDAVRFFIIDLMVLGNMNLLKCSFDTFQSEAAVQALNRFGLESVWLSVDKTNDNYLSFIDLINHGRYKAGPSIIMRNNLFSLQMKRRKGKEGKAGAGTLKIDHTDGDLVVQYPPFYNPLIKDSWKTSWNEATCFTGIHAKDSTDAACGNVSLLRTINPITYKLWEPDKIVDRNYDSVKVEVKDWMNKKGLIV
jgi:hypothetical protein